MIILTLKNYNIFERFSWVNFSLSSIDDVTIITTDLERATLVDVPEFKELINKEIESGKLKFIIDLAGCEYIDSTFLGAIIVSLKTLVKKGGELRVVASSSLTESTFQVTGVTKILPLFSSLDEAWSDL